MKNRCASCKSSIVIAVVVLFLSTLSVKADPAVPEIPPVNVTFGHEPYGDHTQASIGVKMGWFGDVGITLGMAAK